MNNKKKKKAARYYKYSKNIVRKNIQYRWLRDNLFDYDIMKFKLRQYR